MGVALLVLVVLISTCYSEHVKDLEHVLDPAVVNCAVHLKELQAKEYGVSVNTHEANPYFGGDTLLSQQLCQTISSTYQTRKKRAAMIKSPDARWENKNIKFKFDQNSHTPEQKDSIRSALHHWEAQTCMRFEEVAYTTEVVEPHLEIAGGSSCVSFVGKSSGQIPQPLYIGASCFDAIGTILRVTGRVLGLWPEHVRSDRDNHITIHGQHAGATNKGSLENKVPANLINTYYHPYDYASVMHFHAKEFSTNGQHTIKPTDELHLRTIGQKVGVSFLDAKLVNLAYNCSEKCNQKLSAECQNGGYQNPNECSRCKCPDGFGGTYCDELAPSVGAACGGEISLKDEETIKSPGYDTDSYYNAGQECTWRIRAAYGGNINLTFVGEFGVYSSPQDVCYHWVETRIKEPYNHTGYRFCGKDRPTVVLQSGGDEMMIVLKSNWSDATSGDRRGFQIKLKQVNYDPCKSSPCKNGGTCNTDKTSTNGYRCQCAAGYTGKTCATDICEVVSTPCKNGGTCKGKANGYDCICTPRYTGIYCDSVVTEPPCSSSPCKNGATCTDEGDEFLCKCASGYTGTLCDRVVVNGCDPSPCRNGGTCVKTSSGGYNCYCPKGYEGVNCERPQPNSCSDNPCMNGATCHEMWYGFWCICAENYNGQRCENKKPCLSSPCLNGGSCYNRYRSFYCYCPGSYEGDRCETKRKLPCDSSPCVNGGTCTDINYRSRYMCDCPPDYKGENCQTKRVNACDSGPCKNGATCIRMGESYQCLCADQYQGINCDTKKPPPSTCSECAKTRKAGDCYTPCAGGQSQTTLCVYAENQYHKTYSSFFFFRHSKYVRRTVYKTKTCVQKSCCAGHVWFQSHSGEGQCGVPGWSEWDKCHRGVQYRELWGKRTNGHNVDEFVRLDQECRSCESAEKPPRRRRWWW